MIAELLTGLARANLAAAAAIIVVLTLRKPARRLFGARAAYALWIVAPLAALAVLLPARSARLAVAPPPSPMATAHALTGLPVGPGLIAPALAVDQAVSRMTAPATPAAGRAQGADPWLLPLNIWLVGVVCSLGLLVWRQRRFLASLGRLSPLMHDGERLLQAERAGIGPAVVGALFPRVVAPADFATRFTPAEQAIVLAHERAHLARQDARVNGLVALAQCAAWFNPLVQIAAYFIRLDQELACDATVMADRPGERRRYAEALLKTQLGAAALPLGCYWPARAPHPLEERIGMLKVSPPSRARRRVGLAAIVILGSAVGLAAWASQPAQSPRPPATVLAQADAVPMVHVTPASATAPAVLTTAGPDASGDWIGQFRGPPNLQVAFHVRRDSNGVYAGTIDVPEQSTYDLALGKITVDGDTLTVFDPHIRGTYTARWDATDAQWVGDWRQIDLDIPLTLRRGRFPPAPTVAGLDGAWDGVLPVNGGMRLGMNIATTDQRGTMARFDLPDQKAYGVLANSIARQGDKVAIAVKPMSGVIDARLSPDGQTLSGVFTLSGTGVALTLTRRAPGAPAPYAPAPPRPTAPAPLPPEPPMVSVDAKQLQAYVGRYDIAPNRAFTVTLENGRLFVVRPDQIKLEIFPSSPRDFFSKETNLQATFPTAAGHPAYVVLRENGRYEIGTWARGDQAKG
jgi:beta-lactamase regulating signal transducer with metallopeptidase domain